MTTPSTWKIGIALNSKFYLSNTSTPSISNLIPRFESDKTVRGFLVAQYNSTNDASVQLQIESKLHNLLKNKVSVLLMFNFLKKLTPTEAKLKNSDDATLFVEYGLNENLCTL